MPFAQHYQETLEELARVCASCGRDPREVKVIAVSKTVDAPAISAAITAGAHDFGENRPDVLAAKVAQLPEQTWHFIGNVQSRKIPEIVACASLVHSVCKEEHFAKFDQAAERLGKVQDILLEVNVSGEESKSGFTPDEAIAALQLAETFPHIAVRGLMTMAPQGNLDVARECFEGLAALRDALRSQLPSEQAARFNELSMGMSEDWREAVCAGATMVRIGRALFSDSFEPVRA
ncbi:YggS family pyridoxal phosphate-dependent enzyme [uncultured Senegalimassilia sp.]|uniref:YggS family pyridoxal phosphate-dependent enzyme n=1 Tax=uncultured Senegalimassilia sp. TaxID=1714350 RepID=UPI0025E1D683|nr:YggS family pyridoxal phosphate-dependent enzyme [uncultured Senegalimassilia sp.]